MSITIETVKKVARLARIHLPDDQQKVAQLQGELNAILDWVTQLSEVDTQNVEPLMNPAQLHHESTPLRDDSVTEGNLVDEILANAPEKAHDMFVVPKVVA